LGINQNIRKITVDVYHVDEFLFLNGDSPLRGASNIVPHVDVLRVFKGTGLIIETGLKQTSSGVLHDEPPLLRRS
jgi:hypothetical protein